MKYCLCMILAFLMTVCSCALGEPADPSGYELAPGKAVQLDLDGDGGSETVEWKSIALEYDEAVMVRVNGKVVWNADCLMGACVYAVDLDSDGKVELLVSGDEMSDDYVTFCLRWQEGTVQMLPFANICRGESDEAVTEYGYGKVTAIGDNLLELTGSQDVLGTYFGSRKLMLCDGWFMIADDGLWRFERDVSDPEIWEYGSLTLLEEIPAMFVTETEPQKGTLKSGEKILVTASDKLNVVWFVTQDGREGFLTILPDEENGWGHCIDGKSETELFEYVPYAD